MDDLNIEPLEDGTGFRLRGSLDMARAYGLRDRLAEEVTGTLHLDLSELRFMDSVGLAAFLTIGRRCQKAGGDLLLLHPTGQVRRVFELVRMDRAPGVRIVYENQKE